MSKGIGYVAVLWFCGSFATASNKTNPLLLVFKMLASNTALHTKCCVGIYLNSAVQRFTILEQYVSWAISFPGYNPPYYDSPVLHGKTWADPPIGKIDPYKPQCFH